VRPTTIKSLGLWQGAALIALLVATAVIWMRLPASSEPPDAFEASLPEGATGVEEVSVSPDGRKLVMSTTAGTTRGALWVRDFNSFEWRRLPDTESARSPFWSPDSRHLAFAVGNQLKALDTSGGPAETLCTVPGTPAGSGSWNRDGVIIFGSWSGGSGGPVWKVSQTGGAPVPVTEVDTAKGELYHTWPVFLEDGHRFVYFRSGAPDVAGVYVGSLDADARNQSRDRILATTVPVAYADGHLFFARGPTTMMAQSFDKRRLKVEGAAVPIAELVQNTWFGTKVFAASAGGVLAYQPSQRVDKFEITTIDRQGTMVSTVGPPSLQGWVTVSPDGKRAVVRDTFYDVPGDLWNVDVATGERTRLTFNRNDYSPGAWSPDGTRLAYAGGDLGDTLYEKRAVGNGSERELFKEPGTRHFVTSWSRDGRFLLYHTENTPKTGYDVWALPLEGERKPVRLLGEPFNEWAAQFSPDMRWIVYASLETGGANAEVFVRPFIVSPSGVPRLGDGKWQVSTGGGNWPIWRTQNEILFNANDMRTNQAISAARVKTSDTVFESATPQVLFRVPPGTASWDVMPDGERFLLIVPQALQTAVAPIRVVLNWNQELKERAPTK
jgi:Tol biopolymer transport system component